jgi:hypothetical protein
MQRIDFAFGHVSFRRGGVSAISSIIHEAHKPLILFSREKIW